MKRERERRFTIYCPQSLWERLQLARDEAQPAWGRKPAASVVLCDLMHKHLPKPELTNAAQREA